MSCCCCTWCFALYHLCFPKSMDSSEDLLHDGTHTICRLSCAAGGTVHWLRSSRRKPGSCWPNVSRNILYMVICPRVVTRDRCFMVIQQHLARCRQQKCPCWITLTNLRSIFPTPRAGENQLYHTNSHCVGTSRLRSVEQQSDCLLGQTHRRQDETVVTKYIYSSLRGG